MFGKWFGRIVKLLTIYLAYQQLRQYFAEEEVHVDFPTQISSTADNVAKKSSSSDYEIKLAIFCDTEFSKRFGNNRDKIQQYWKAVLYDVHLRFLTLPSFKISFKVTSLNFLQKADEEVIIPPGYDRSNPEFLQKVHASFEIGTYLMRHKIPEFDIPVLALGTQPPLGDTTYGIMRHGTICEGKNDQEKYWASSVTIPLTSHIAHAMARNIAYTLGAPLDDDPAYWNICNYQNFNSSIDCCVMKANLPVDKIQSPHYFSQCTNKVLAKILSKKNISCLKPKTLKTAPVIDTAKVFHNPSNLPQFSMEEQCQLYAESSNAFVKHSGCAEVHCMSSNGIDGFRFVPLDGTPCGNTGYGQCLRAICVEPQVRLVNVGTGTCLVSEHGQFASNDKPMLRDCSQIPFDWNVNPIKDVSGGRRLPLSLTYLAENARPGIKTLSMSGDTRVGYKARFETSVQLRSPLTVDRLKGTQGEEFLLSDLATGICVRAAKDTGKIQFLPGCKKEDAFARWKLVKINGATELNMWSKGFGPYLKHEPQFGFTILACLLMYFGYEYLQWWWPRRHMPLNIRVRVRQSLGWMRMQFYHIVDRRVRRR